MEWKRESANIQANIQANIAALKSAHTYYILEGIRLLELAEKGVELFGVMTNDEKCLLFNRV
jgi:hypothetical protein